MEEQHIPAAGDRVRTGSDRLSGALTAGARRRAARTRGRPSCDTPLRSTSRSWTGEHVRRNLAELPSDDPAATVGAFLDRIRSIVADAAVGRSCAVAAVVMEAGQHDVALTSAAGAALSSWVAALEGQFVALGATPASARQAATLLIVFLEGTQVLCRALGDLAPFDAGRAAVEASVTALLRVDAPDLGTQPPDEGDSKG